MGTSVLNCALCRQYYPKFFKQKRKMMHLARYHKEFHENGKRNLSRPENPA